MYNPRWPYSFVIVPEYLDANGLPVTDANGDPCEPTPPVNQLDENGIPLTDKNGDPVNESQNEETEQLVETQEAAENDPEPTPETTPTVLIAEYDTRWNPRKKADGSFVSKEVSVVPWGYRTSTGGMKTSGEVIVADYKISCPMILTNLPTGTILSMTDAVKTFRVKVIKMTTYNWGTNIWCDNILN